MRKFAVLTALAMSTALASPMVMAKPVRAIGQKAKMTHVVRAKKSTPSLAPRRQAKSKRSAHRSTTKVAKQLRQSKSIVK